MCPLELLVTANGLLHKGAVEHDAPVIDPLVKLVIDPLALTDREFGQSLLDGHLGFYIPEVVGFEPRPFFRGILRAAAELPTVPALGRGTEVADEVLALLQLLFLQAEDSSHTLQREGETQGRRPHHRAAPGGWVEVFAYRHLQPAGQAHALELGIESPLGYGRVGEGRQHLVGEPFSSGEIHHLDGSAVRRITEQQNLKAAVLAVAVHATLFQRSGRVGFDINRQCFHAASFPHPWAAEPEPRHPQRMVVSVIGIGGNVFLFLVCLPLFPTPSDETHDGRGDHTHSKAVDKEERHQHVHLLGELVE